MQGPSSVSSLAHPLILFDTSFSLQIQSHASKRKLHNLTKPMPSLHPIAKIKTSWRWLTTTTDQEKKPKTHQAPIQKASDYNNRKANLNPQKPTSHPTPPSPHLAIPEPALHRLQELKSPPPLPHSQSQSPTAPYSVGFKSRPLYRRTHSASRDLEEGGMGVEKAKVMKDEAVRVGKEGSEETGGENGGGRGEGCRRSGEGGWA
ncbi:MAG: hypothetical protein ALECFALPRED_010276 [Alectoria fallacina]|uniref:Uncharacterized protein n=1 Tax=Alectoria fallacina TaxID=1903189 RepID=A0A8H3J991_9LECA|nr:MAG: hypothetical protein ALECFALPRED_010276 [Alectoria fallacina]